MGRQRSCTNLWRRFPPDPAKMGGASGYISGRFAIGSSDFFSFSDDDDFVYTDPEAYSPLTRLAAGPSDLDLLGWSAFSTRPSIAAVPVPFAAAIRRLSRKSLKEQIGVLMPRRHCGSCRSPLHAMTVTASVFPAWGNPMQMPLRWLWLFSLREHQSRLSALADRFLFRERPRPSRPPCFSSSQGPVRKKQRGKRFSAPGWERAHAGSYPGCLAFATQRGVSRPFFPTWPASLCKRERFGLVRGKWRWAGRWQHVTGSFRCWGAVGLSDWPRPLRFARAQRRKAGMDAELFVSSQKRLKSWVWSGLHQRSPLAAVWMSGFCQGAVRPLSNDHCRSSLKFTTS